MKIPGCPPDNMDEMARHHVDAHLRLGEIGQDNDAYHRYRARRIDARSLYHAVAGFRRETVAGGRCCKNLAVVCDFAGC
jgi:hypothetical protein